jgi:hypothetical protein
VVFKSGKSYCRFTGKLLPGFIFYGGLELELLLGVLLLPFEVELELFVFAGVVEFVLLVVLVEVVVLVLLVVLVVVVVLVALVVFVVVEVFVELLVVVLVYISCCSLIFLIKIPQSSAVPTPPNIIVFDPAAAIT